VGCSTSEYRLPYAQAVTELKAMYPIPTGDDAEYRKALAHAYPAYSPEALAVPGFPIQWDLVVSAAEITPNLEFRINILKNWKLMAARRTSISAQAVGASAVRVNVVSERQMGGDLWLRDGVYEMQRRDEIERRFKTLAAQGPAAPAPAAAPRKFAPIGQKARSASAGEETAAPVKPVPATPPRSGRPAAGGPGRAAAPSPVPPMAPPPSGSVNDEPQTIP
jgi:hypothetical protein